MNHDEQSAVAMQQQMKKIGRKISILMGITLSFFLSLVGNALSGHFAVVPWLISFAVSTIVSLLIGFCVPMKPLLDAVDRACHLQPGKFSTHCLETLISDVIYTPIITLLMVALAYHSAVSHGAQGLQFLPMFLHSLGIEMIVGFILIFIFMPLYMKLVMKKPA